MLKFLYGQVYGHIYQHNAIFSVSHATVRQVWEIFKKSMVFAIAALCVFHTKWCVRHSGASAPCFPLFLLCLSLNDKNIFGVVEAGSERTKNIPLIFRLLRTFSQLPLYPLPSLSPLFLSLSPLLSFCFLFYPTLPFPVPLLCLRSRGRSRIPDLADTQNKRHSSSFIFLHFSSSFLKVASASHCRATTTDGPPRHLQLPEDAICCERKQISIRPEARSSQNKVQTLE